jgi:hypothetical protein
MIGGDMVIHINSQQAAVFKRHFESPVFTEERDYKWAVHLLVSGLLSYRSGSPDLRVSIRVGGLDSSQVMQCSKERNAYRT